MAVAVQLTPDDLRQLAHGYIWILTQELFKTQKPDFSKADIQALSSFLSKAGKVNHPCFQLKKVEMTARELAINGEPVLKGPQKIARLIQCAQLFLEEMGDSPTEIEVLSNAPFSNLPDLVSRLNVLQKSAEK